MNCFFCQKPSQQDGTTYHHPNCVGLEDARLTNLQAHFLAERIKALEEILLECCRALKDGSFGDAQHVYHRASTLCSPASARSQSNPGGER